MHGESTLPILLRTESWDPFVQPIEYWILENEEVECEYQISEEQLTLHARLKRTRVLLKARESMFRVQRLFYAQGLNDHVGPCLPSLVDAMHLADWQGGSEDSEDGATSGRTESIVGST